MRKEDVDKLFDLLERQRQIDNEEERIRKINFGEKPTKEQREDMINYIQ